MQCSISDVLFFFFIFCSSGYLLYSVRDRSGSRTLGMDLGSCFISQSQRYGLKGRIVKLIHLYVCIHGRFYLGGAMFHLQWHCFVFGLAV